MSLDERKARILRAVVEEHIETGLPVGSRVIARRYRLGISPATVRNEMSDLEETGYLDKPHTSSGRVPSDKGYRFYVDELMPQKTITPEESRVIQSLFLSKVRDAVSVLREMVKTVSEVTNYLAFVLGPEAEDVTYQAIHLLPASPGKALMVIVTDAGFVESCMIDTPIMSCEEMNYVSQMLTRNLQGLGLEKVVDRAYALLKEQTSRYSKIVEQLVEFLETLASDSDSERLYIGGTVNLLSQPEFRDVNRVREVLSAIESEGIIQAVISREPQDSDPAISIGSENAISSARELSMVYGTFTAGRAEGKIGLIGPRRMDYSRAVAIVRFCEEKLSEFFSQEN